MGRPLRLLLIEDNDDDAALLLRELKRSGREVDPHRVQTATEMREALAHGEWDVIIADYSLPQFGAMAAVELLKESGNDLPFIIVSGTIGEETAVDALKAGAHDFLLKGRLARLIPAIDREMREAAVRRERREAIEQLKEAVRARDEFLSIASHELKTPLTSLALQVSSALGFVRRDRGRAIPLEKLQAKLEIATKQVVRLTALINNLLDVTRITAGKLPLTRTSVDLKDLVEGALARFRELLKQSSSELVFRAEGPVVGSWDPLALESVVTNLVSNALKFGEGKPIEVTVRHANGVATLVVRDQGIGIAPEDQHRIFQRFERAVSSRHYGGFGIGLWVARQVVEAHGGTVAVTSEKGVGSTFSVGLPLQAADAPAPQPSAAR